MNEPVNPIRIVIKAVLLFLVVSLLGVAFYPFQLGNISAYNIIFPGRERFPFGENPQEAYNFSLFDLTAMFKSLALDGQPKKSDEYRVIVIGDSSVWGTLLRPEETLSGQLNIAGLSACGKKVKVYNLGYPTISLTKDLMLLDQAMSYDPDLVVWMTTLEAFPAEKQLSSPIVAHNPEKIREIVARFGVGLNPNDPGLVRPSFFDKTIPAQRRPIMDLVRLQLYGVMWAATGIDQVYPADYKPAATDLEAEESYYGQTPPNLDSQSLAFDILSAGITAAGDTPVLLVNEPILVSSGRNSDIRYNFFYPRWAYDVYRQLLADFARENGQIYLDLWNLVPPERFTNSAIHLDPEGEKILSDRVGAEIVSQCGQ
jgi:hypothetical protein